MKVLRVLDAPAQVLLVGIRLERLLEDVRASRGWRGRRWRGRRAGSRAASRARAVSRIVGDGRRCSGRCRRACRRRARAARRRAARARRRSTLDRAHGEEAAAVADRPVLARGWRRATALSVAQHDPEPHASACPRRPSPSCRSTVANDEPASWNDRDALGERPRRTRARAPCGRAARSSSGVRGGSPAPRRISRDAVSRKRPVGLPFASLMDVAARRDSACLAGDARQLHRLARWRSSHGRWRASGATGLFGDTLLSASWSGKPSTLGSGFAVHFSWCQPRP